jgi:hypothetical protein
VSVFLDNARKIFEVACAGADADATDFALLVGDDGGLHLIMESPVSLEAAAIYTGARTAYRVIRSSGGVQVTGRSPDQNLVLENRSPCTPAARRLLRDQPLYNINSPLLASASCG